MFISSPLLCSLALAGMISYVLGYALLLTALSLLFRRRILALAHVLSLHRRPQRKAAATVWARYLVCWYRCRRSAQAQSVSQCSYCSTPTFQSYGLSEAPSHMLFHSPWSPGWVISRSERWMFLCSLRCWPAHYPELRSGA